ncbi:MAG: sigma-70 family RNA polymerase sigma factor [Planctomycetota bacterium]|nr:sigma-70 family RNA polymerase sigma factor [Planctomycetota bacterium]
MANQSWPLNTEYGSTTSRTLLMRVREPQDRLAWEEFVNRYAPKIFNWCRRYQLQESDAADVTQEVLVKLVRAMQDFQYDPARGSFRGWLKTVTANAVRDLVGSWKKVGRGSGDTAVGQVLATIEDEQAIEALSTEIETCHQQELLAEAERLVQPRVQSHTWQAYQLTAVEQRTAADVAQRLDMPISEVYVAKSRVLKMLRDAVQQISDE